MYINNNTYLAYVYWYYWVSPNTVYISVHKMNSFDKRAPQTFRSIDGKWKKENMAQAT